MPILSVLLGRTPDAVRDAEVAATLAALTADILRKDARLTSVAIAHVPDTRWFVGGATLAAQDRTSFFVDVRVTAGTNTPEERARYISVVFERMRELLGDVHEASYVHVHEVGADSWGYGGRTQAERATARARVATAHRPSPNDSPISS